MTVAATAAGLPLLTLFTGRMPAGAQTQQWDVGILANGRYKLVVSATKVGEVTPVVASVDVTVDRTLGAFLATPASFSPNGDGSNDTMTLSFQLTQSATVQVAIQRARRERGHRVLGAARSRASRRSAGTARASAPACPTASTSRS